MWWDVCYLSTIVFSKSLEFDFVPETVAHLLEKHNISLDADVLIHSEQGFHYTSKKFRQLLKDCDLRQSMSRCGIAGTMRCWKTSSVIWKTKLTYPIVQRLNRSSWLLMIGLTIYNNDRYQWQIAKLSQNEFYIYLTTDIYSLKDVLAIQDIEA